MTSYLCPACRSAIALEDVNVASDLALCRSCGKTSPFSMVSGVSELAQVPQDAAPKGVTVTQGITGGTEIIYRRISKIVFFLVPFMMVWSGFSLSGIYGRQIVSGRFDLSQSLFGLPFLLGTVVMLGVVLFLLFGRWRVRMSAGQGEVFAGVGPIGWTRRFPYGPQSLVSLELTNIQRNRIPQKAITVRTGNDEIRFGTGIQEDAKRFIAAAILRSRAE